MKMGRLYCNEPGDQVIFSQLSSPQDVWVGAVPRSRGHLLFDADKTQNGIRVLFYEFGAKCPDIDYSAKFTRLIYVFRKPKAKNHHVRDWANK